MEGEILCNKVLLLHHQTVSPEPEVGDKHQAMANLGLGEDPQ